jgi:hypothetical protein
MRAWLDQRELDLLPACPDLLVHGEMTLCIGLGLGGQSEKG